MATCEYCRREMATADSCTVKWFRFHDGDRPRIRFGSERPIWRLDRCGDCWVERGAFHHPGCDIEQCPRCLHQAISCGCADGEVDTAHSEWRPRFEVEAAVAEHAAMLRDEFGSDQIVVEPVAKCGHVGLGHLRDIDRVASPPVGEWFGLIRLLNPWVAAALFTSRSDDPFRVAEKDLDLAREIDSYAKDHCEVPWELVYVTRTGQFRASDLLGLPGHPRFEACAFGPEPTRRSARSS